MKFKQFAKRSARVLPADLWTGHAHYVKNHRSTVKHGSRRRDCFSPGFSLLYFGNSQIYWSYVAFQIVCGFLFSAKQFPSAEFGICNIRLRIADKNRRRVELSSSVLLQTLGKLKSLQGTELSVVVVICFRIVLNFNFGFKVLTDRNKRSEMLWSVNFYSVICRSVSS